MDSYQQAGELGDQGKLEQAWRIILPMLIDNPNDYRALVTAGYIMRRLGALPQAYHFSLSATRVNPKDSAGWTNLGHAASEMWLVDEAEKYYRIGLKCADSQVYKTALMVNLSALYIDNGRFDEAETLARKILERDPTHRNAKANLGFCQLAKRNWEGWKGYRETIGSDWRPRVQYNNEPEWDGTPGKVIALYADQGLGDEISFASMVPDAIDICKRLIIDCDDRLAGLFRRSFPQAKVYGTKRAKEGQWDKSDWDIEGSLPLGQIGEYFRTSDASFPGTPYLIPCPDRVRMWKALFNRPKPTIGIAWSGGVAKTNARNRQVSLKELMPLFGIDAHFVSLQYKDASKEIAEFKLTHDVDLVQYPFGTLTKDYDDTAALIASLDYVVCIQTAVAHTAGALGVPVAVLVPEATQWRYGNSHDAIPWYQSLKVIKQKKTGSWRQEIERADQTVRTHLAGVPRGTGTLAQPGQLRDGIDSICAAGIPDYQSYGSDALAGLRLGSNVQSGQASQSRSQTDVSSL